jgi:ribosomal-protein-alanine N-acetyltransferase
MVRRSFAIAARARRYSAAAMLMPPSSPRPHLAGAGALRVRGPRLALRLPTAADAAALHALARDPQVTAYFSWGPYRSEAEAAAWLATLPARRESGTALELAIVDAADAPIGITLLTELARRDRRAVVGTWLGRAHWGTGANREAKALLAQLAFGPLRLERLAAYADVRNARSRSALQRLGFVYEGRLRSFHRHQGAPRDVALYALLREDWERSDTLHAIPVTIEGHAPAAFVADGG